MKISRLNSSGKLWPRHGQARSPNNSSRSYAPTDKIDTGFARRKKTEKLKKSQNKKIR